MNKIAAPRIGTGKGYFIVAAVAAGFALLLSLIAAGGGDGAGALASLFFAFAAGCVAVGFWTRLFGLIELRMIDIQKSLAPEATVATPGRPAATDYSQQY